MTNVTYTARITYYDTPEQMARLKALAAQQGKSATELLRELADEALKQANGKQTD